MEEWNNDFENSLKESADKAEFYNWAHLKSYRKYNIINKLFMIPVVIISAISGSINLAHIFETYSSSLSLGILNMVISIMVIVYQTLKIPETGQEHRGSARAWGKFYEYIKAEIDKKPLNREEPSRLLRYCVQHSDHIISFSPSISQEYIKIFQETHKNVVVPRVFYNSRIKNVADETLV
jgi:hypothetical protein